MYQSLPSQTPENTSPRSHVVPGRATRPLAVILGGLLLASAVTAEPRIDDVPSEWDPIEYRFAVGWSDDFGVRVGLATVLPQGRPAEPPFSGGEDAADANLSTRDLSGDQSHRPIRSISFEFGEIQTDTDRDFLDDVENAEELEILYFSTDARLNFRKLLSKTENSQRELRYFIGAGVGIYDLGITRRAGPQLKLGARYAFGEHAHRGIEFKLTYHRLGSELDFVDYDFGFVWRPQRRCPICLER